MVLMNEARHVGQRRPRHGIQDVGADEVEVRLGLLPGLCEKVNWVGKADCFLGSVVAAYVDALETLAVRRVRDERGRSDRSIRRQLASLQEKWLW